MVTSLEGRLRRGARAELRSAPDCGGVGRGTVAPNTPVQTQPPVQCQLLRYRPDDGMASSFLVLLLAMSVSAYPAEKPGMCIRRFFPAVVCSPADIVNTCQRNDYLCPGTQKCCQTAHCVTSCEEPAKPKPGECPTASRVEPGSSNCDVDSDCGLDDNKCCKNHSGGTRCSPPRGNCPDTTGIITTCQVTAANCFSDSKCSPDRLCCPYGCGRQCLRPVP